MVVPPLIRLAAAAVCVLALAPAARAATTVPEPVYDERGHLVQVPFVPRDTPVELDAAGATRIFLAHPKVRDWLDRYPPDTQTEATLENGIWTVKAWSGEAGQIAEGTVFDATREVGEAWTGPQVAWRMGRGYEGAFGGKQINSLPVWLGFCAAFLLGLVDWRRPLSMRTLDLLVLLSFSVSLWFFNRGQVFECAILAYPPLVYLLVRAVLAVRRGRAPAGNVVWPVWLLAAATVFILGFRIGLNVRDSNVIDVGYAGVIGADRIWNLTSPYGNFPKQDDLEPCGPADAAGEIRDRIQENGRCESANPLGDTYGPITYVAYLPGYLALGWSGKWDDLPAVHFTTLMWDILAVAAMYLVGRRFGGARLGVTLAFAWVTFPFTQYVSSSNTNDAIMPTLLLLGFWAVTSDTARGALLAFAGWAKFAAFIVAPAWLAYPRLTRRRALTALGGFAAATVASLSVLFFEPDVFHSFRVFWERTVWIQVTRASPFGLWDWGQYHAKGIPDLGWAQKVLQVLLVAGAIAAAFRPREKSPYQLAALTAALLVGFQIVLTHWSWLYIPWFFPFVAFVALASGAPRRRAPEPAEAPELVAA